MPKPGVVIAQGLATAEPVYGWRGIRHKGGVSAEQAWIRNLGTCRPDAKRETQADKTVRVRVSMRGTGAERSVVALNGV